MMEEKVSVSNAPEPQVEQKRGTGQQEEKKDRAYQESAQVVDVEMSENNMPIKALNQFNNDWRIKARILKKADLRMYKNAKGEGCILNLDLIDREGTMIQATAFNDTAKKINDQVEQNQVYTFAGG